MSSGLLVWVSIDLDRWCWRAVLRVTVPKWLDYGETGE